MDLTKPSLKQNLVPETQPHMEDFVLGDNQPGDKANSNQSSNVIREEKNDLADGFEWKDGIGTLPGYDDLKFRMNEAGEVDLITDDLPISDSPLPSDVTTGRSGEAKKHANGKMEYEGSVMTGDDEADDLDASGTDNIEIVSVRSDAVADAQMKCPVCGIYGSPSEFRGRFCSRKCVAKNANQHRSTSMRLKREHGQSYQQASTDSPSVIHSKNGRSNDLKIRIRLSSSPPLDAGEVATKKKHSNSASALHPLVEKRRKKFSWADYVSEEGAEMAPPSAFQALIGKSPFAGTNQFKLGMALEGVDPTHQSLICPLSVTAVKGFRVRLHFCGFSESYDFWTNADSPLIFPCGFCEKTGRKLEVPKGYLSENFHWDKYMKKFRLYPAPDVIFSIIREEKDCSFKPEEKLEAVDKHNPGLICVATIGDVIGENILIHFDGWTHDFDYWCTSKSRLIHPVGWCGKVGKVLTPPEGFPQTEFSWSAFLSECGASAASEDSFSPPTPHGLKSGMKLEVVDPRNPILIRVASILTINEYRVQIHFDGWSDIYDFWIDLESPDIHPPGWCAKANYPLQPPVTADELVNVPGQGGCPVPGCIGVGHVRGSKFVGHHSEFGCPYSQQNLHKQNLHDRLSRPRLSTNAQEASSYKSDSDAENALNGDPRPAKIRRTTRKSMLSEVEVSVNRLTNGRKSTSPPATAQKKTIVSSSELDALVDENGKSHYSTQNHSVFVSALSSFPNYDLPLCWDQHSKILPSVKGITVSDVSKWSVSDVVCFVSELTGRAEYGKVFAAEEIDGEAMLLLTQTDIAKVLNIKLGPAVKIYNAILLVKAAEHLPV